MPETTHGLRIQTAHAIARNTELTQQLMVFVNRFKEDSGENVEVPVELLATITHRLGNDSLVMQKLDAKIDKLNKDLFNA